MKFLKLCRSTLIRFFIALALISSLLVPPGFCQETEDSQIFISGFNAYQQKDYASAIEKMNEVLQKYPDTPLRDMALFWLSRAYFKSGNQQDAARFMSQFSKEYPDNPLKGTVEEELLSLTARYEKGEKLPAGAPPQKPAEKLSVAQKAKEEKERLAARQAEEARAAKAKAEQERAAALKAEQDRLAAQKAEQARLAQEKAAAEKRAAEKAEQERLAALKVEQERKAAEQAEQQRLAKAKAEQERIAALKAEEERAAAAAADAARLAAEKKEQERLANARIEQERLSAEKAERERIAAEKAEQERLAQETAAAKKLAAERAEQQRVAALKAEEERKAAEQAEQQRVAKAKAEQERIAALQADQERLAAQKAEQERLAQEKAAAEKRAAEKAEQERVAALKAEQERKAAEQAEQQRLAKAKAEQDRIAALKAEEERAAAAAAEAVRLAAEKKEQERLASAKIEQERIAKEKAERERIAAEKAEQERLAQEEAAAEKLAHEKSEQQRLAALRAEEERKGAEQAEQQRVAKAKAEQERISALKAEEDRAAAAAEAAKLAAAKHEQERLAAEKAAGEAEAARVAAAKQEQERLAAAKAEEQRLALQRETEEKNRREKAALREKAIAQYKAIIDRYPTSKAAVTAAAKLKELGVAVALPPSVTAEAKPAEQPENAQVLRLQVAQFAGFEFNLLSRPPAFEVARRVAIPFEIINRGNGNDSFSLESAFPAEFSAVFAAADNPDKPITQTSILTPGESFRGIVSLVIPASSIDGLRITHPIKAVSRFMTEATQSREVSLIAAAPLLRAVLKADKPQPLPGEKISYRIAVLNVGSIAAQNVTFRLSFPPQLEPVSTDGFKSESKSTLVLDPLQVNSGESKDFTVTFQLKDDALANQELLCRAELINNPLKTSASFISNVANVRPTHGVLVRSGSERIVIIPGQTFTVPYIVTNTGNIREKFKIASTVTGAQEAIIFHDLNRDGIKQSNEPVITEVGPLEPKEEASIVIEIKTARSAADGADGNVVIAFSSEGDPSRSGSSSTKLVYSRPVLQMAMAAAQDGRLKPGDVASFDLVITNRGSNLARIVELQSAWPQELELVAADPINSTAANGKIIWKFKELGAGEKRTIKVSFRVKPGTSVGTNIQVTNVLTYEDQLGNRY